MDELPVLLAEARDKTEAEQALAKLRRSLSELDASILELNASRTEVSRRIKKSKSPIGRLRRGSGHVQADHIELNRLSSLIAEMEVRRETEQHQMRNLEGRAHGAELARAQLGAEMDRRTNSLDRDCAEHLRLVEIDDQRAVLLRERRMASKLASMALELLLLVDEANKADDKSDENVYVELQSASRKYEEFQKLLRRDALTARRALRDRLEAFRVLDASRATHAGLADLDDLVADDVVTDHQVWMHRVNVALKALVSSGGSEEASIRAQLVEIDNERIDILTQK